nr:hypothetical protein [Roseomonas marmotae]
MTNATQAVAPPLPKPRMGSAIDIIQLDQGIAIAIDDGNGHRSVLKREALVNSISRSCGLKEALPAMSISAAYGIAQKWLNRLSEHHACKIIDLCFGQIPAACQACLGQGNKSLCHATVPVWRRAGDDESFHSIEAREHLDADVPTQRPPHADDFADIKHRQEFNDAICESRPRVTVNGVRRVI